MSPDSHDLFSYWLRMFRISMPGGPIYASSAGALPSLPRTKTLRRRRPGPRDATKSLSPPGVGLLLTLSRLPRTALSYVSLILFLILSYALVHRVPLARLTNFHGNPLPRYSMRSFSNRIELTG